MNSIPIYDATVPLACTIGALRAACEVVVVPGRGEVRLPKAWEDRSVDEMVWLGGGYWAAWMGARRR